jgi:hypothetical protein
MGPIATSAPLPEPDRDENRGDGQEEERLHDRPHGASVGDRSF